MESATWCMKDIPSCRLRCWLLTIPLLMRTQKVVRRRYSGYVVLDTIIRNGDNRDFYYYGQREISMEWHFGIRRCSGVVLFNRYASTGMCMGHINGGYGWGHISEPLRARRLDRH